MATPLQFAYRTQKAIGIFDAAPVYETIPGFVKPEGNLRCCVYSPCGRYFAYATGEGVTVVDASVGHVIATLPIVSVYDLSFSPRGSFLSTWERPAKDENGDATKNLKIWRTVEDLPQGTAKAPLGSFVQKAQSGWALQYTADERFCARMVTNEVQFYDSNDLRTVANKLRVEGVSDFAVAPGQNQNVAVFIPERKVSFFFFFCLSCSHSFYCLAWRKLTSINHYHRVNPLPSRCSMYRSSRPPSRRRLSSRVIRFSSSGTTWVPALSCWHRQMWTSRTRATMVRPTCTC